MNGPSEQDRHRSLVGHMRTAPPFVGRQQHLDWLTRCLQDAVTGHPHLVLIPGEAGIGKTRLLNEVQAAARRRGVQTYYGRCYEDLALPYLPFVETLLARLEQLSEDEKRTLGTEIAVIRQFLHRDWSPASGAGSAPSDQGNQAKQRLLVTLTQATVKLAQHYPTLVVIDDLHWADPPSLDLFGHLVFTAADTAVREPVSLLIMGAYRPEELAERSAYLIARLEREEICQTLKLPGLDESEMRELLQSLGLVRPSHQLVATIREATQGNPLFVQEVVRHLQQQGALRERGGYLVTATAAADLRLPEHAMGALVARTQGLSEGCRRLLTQAAFLGDRFSLQVLSAVSSMSEEELLDVLDEGMLQHLLLSEDQAFQFAHPLIRHVFYRAPSVPRRQRIHQQIAQTLERLYVDSLEAHVLEIAHHLVRAGSAAEADKVAQYARRAGDQAFAALAWGEAAHYYEAALSAAESTGYLAAQERAELHYRSGLAYYRDQDAGPCLDHYERAIETYQLIGDVRGLAQALMEKTLAHQTFASFPYGTLVDLQQLEDVLDAVGNREPGLSGNIAAVMAEIYRTAKQTDKAQAMAQRALEIGRRIQDDRLCAYASFVQGLAQAQGLYTRATLESWQGSLVHARRADDLWLQGWPLQRIPQILIALGRLNDAEAVALEACELTRKTHDWGGYSVVLSALASMAVARGDFDAVERYAHETLIMVSRSRYPWGGVRLLSALACARALRGAWAEAEDALSMLVEPGRVFPEAGPVYQAFVRVFRQLLQAYADGVVDKAMEPFAAELVRTVGVDSYALAPFCALVELGEFMAAPTMAEQPYQVLSLAVERGVYFSSASGWIFLIPRVLGVAATLNRWWDKAEAHLQAAVEAATKVDARPELGRSYLDYARLLAARGDASHYPRTIELARQASLIFHELGMAPFTRRAAQLLEVLQARKTLVPRQGAAYRDGLSEHEVEILLGIARGRTNFLG
jgi:tetratricopeptide (TPR) repeat protein